MARKNLWTLSAGVALIGLGIIFFLGQLFEVSIMRYLWPVFILAFGALFFIGMIAGGRSLGALAVPGSVITTIGLILFFQNLFGLWSTWAYAWALIIVGAGIGLMIFGHWSQYLDLRRAGQIVAIIGLVLFFIFGMFFELGATLLGMRSAGGIFWAILLILAGLYVVFGQRLFSRLGKEGPMTRSTMDFSERGSSDAETAAASTALSGIRQVRFRALGDMTIIQGQREGLDIEASQAMLERIHTQVSGDTLEIRYDQQWFDWLQPRFWNMSNPLRFTLYVHDLDKLEAAGLGNIKIPSLLTSRLEIQQNGTGNISVRQLEAGDLVVQQAGLGNIEIEGRANRQEMRLSGTGSYQAGRLESGTASIILTGLGSATVWVVESLDARVTGAGSIEYFGNPQVRETVSGLGKVRRLGAR